MNATLNSEKIYFGGWNGCGTCGQRFTGEMKMKLANTWWSKAQHLPKDDPQWMCAANTLATALHHRGKFDEAAKLYRKVRTRARCSESPNAARSFEQGPSLHAPHVALEQINYILCTYSLLW